MCLNVFPEHRFFHFLSPSVLFLWAVTFALVIEWRLFEHQFVRKYVLYISGTKLHESEAKMVKIRDVYRQNSEILKGLNFVIFSNVVETSPKLIQTILPRLLIMKNVENNT